MIVTVTETCDSYVCVSMRVSMYECICFSSLVTVNMTVTVTCDSFLYVCMHVSMYECMCIAKR